MSVDVRRVTSEDVRSEWEDLGDVNFMEHGSTFVRDTEDRNTFIVVKVGFCNWNLPRWSVETATVDISEDWLKWKDMRSYYDIDKEESKCSLASLAFDYYGVYNFGGESDAYYTYKGVVERLIELGVIDNESR